MTSLSVQPPSWSQMAWKTPVHVSLQSLGENKECKLTIARDLGDQLFEEEGQKYSGDGREVEVMNLEQTVQLQWRPVPHDLSATQDNRVVHHQCYRRLLQRRHRGLAADEAKILGSIALDGFESSFEDRPQLQTKRSIECGSANSDPIWLRHFPR